MTAEALASRSTPSLDSLLERLGKRHFSDTPLSIGDAGGVVAQFYRSRVTSGFQPIVHAHGGAVVGHHALLRVESHTGEAVAPWSLFAQASSDAALVSLDRLCRTVHALNYFPSHSSDELLFLNVERRLLTGVAADHGAWFEAVLALIGAPTHRVVIVMPADAVDNPVAFVRAAISYRIRGYRVLVPVRSTTEADLSHVFLADPHFVALDPAALEGHSARRFLEALAQRGTHLVARGIESPANVEAARAAGVELLQGFHFGRP
ncbi:MAG TPA: EAL domain-containing protein [Usitatibacter sp.]|nr:EAL domain-containing protein [Usitatibacter sp.]